MGKRRKFTEEYRRDAALMVIDTGRPIAQVARELGIGEQGLGCWVKTERARREAEADGRRDPREVEAENRRLRRENERLRMENEFLGKASALDAAKHPDLKGSS